MNFDTLLNNKIKEAMINRDEVSRDLLRLVKGTIQQKSTIKDLSEDEKFAVVKSLIKSNEISISAIKDNYLDSNELGKLESQNVILKSLLPASLSEYDILLIVNEKRKEIVSAKSDGQAMGILIKEIKSRGLVAESNDIKKVIENIRAK